MSRRTEKQMLKRECEAFQHEQHKQDEQERVSASEEYYDDWKQRREYERYLEKLEEERYQEWLRSNEHKFWDDRYYRVK